MNKIKTPAPISIDNLKLYFEDKETFYEIDYASSTIKGDKLLVYISNLDIPCDIIVESDEDLEEILLHYLDSSFLVNLPSLESKVIDLLLQYKEIIPVKNESLLSSLKSQLTNWTEKLDSLPLYNMYVINDETIKSWVTESHTTDSTDSLEGVNFVSLLKRPEFYNFFDKPMFEPKYYSTYFNDYMFKGTNLYSFWAHTNNPMFLLTQAIASGQLNTQEYINAVKTSEETQ